MQLLSQGAEARIYKINFLGDQAILKERLSKRYRIPALDERITIERVKNESRLLAKARKLGVNVPHLYHVDNKSIIMMYVEGIKLKDYLNTEGQEKIEQILELTGADIAKLHNGSIIHGDLTTSNIMVKDEKPFFIDFGLSYSKSGQVEDFAVDLYVLEKAFISTHPNLENNFTKLLLSYAQNQVMGDKVIEKLNQVRMRGRKKVAFG